MTSLSKDNDEGGGKIYFWAPHATDMWTPYQVDPAWVQARNPEAIKKELAMSNTPLPLLLLSVSTSASSSSSSSGSLKANSSKGNDAVYSVVAGKAIELPVKDLVPMDSPYALTDCPDDFISLAEVNQATILHACKLRFAKRSIYTSCGDVLMVRARDAGWVRGLGDVLARVESYAFVTRLACVRVCVLGRRTGGMSLSLLMSSTLCWRPSSVSVLVMCTNCPHFIRRISSPSPPHCRPSTPLKLSPVCTARSEWPIIKMHFSNGRQPTSIMCPPGLTVTCAPLEITSVS